jgi:hypothetical protein
MHSTENSRKQFAPNQDGCRRLCDAHSAFSGWQAVAWLLAIPVLAHAPTLWLSPNPIFFTGQINATGSMIWGGLPGYLDLNAGWTTQALGGLAAKLWLSGEVPWWNAYAGVGMPLAAGTQSAALFLPFVLLLALPNGVLWLKVAMMMVGGLACRALLLQLRLLPAAALAGGVMFQISATFAWWADAPLLPVPFLPLLLLGIERARTAAQERRVGGFAIIALALAFSLYAGFPQTAWCSGLLAGAWTILRITQPEQRGARIGFVLRVGLGVVAGLLLAAPLLLPFLHYLSLSTIGDRAEIDFRELHVFPSAFAHYLFPYLFGPIGAFSPHYEMLAFHWGRIGGYVGLGLPFSTLLALAAIRHPVRERVLRVLLGGWILLCLAKMGGLPVLGNVLNVLPLMSMTQFFRYGFTTVLCAAAILFALCLHDRLTGRPSSRLTVLAAGGLMATASVFALNMAWPLLREIGHVAPAVWHFASISLGLGSAGLLTLLIAGLLRRQPGTVAFITLAEAMVLFVVPLLGGMRGGQIDEDAIAWLQEKVGEQRVVTLGTLLPNYPGLFGIASINYVSLPVAREWVDYVRAQLEPALNPTLFLGDFPPPVADRIATLREHLDAYAALGVRWIIARSESDPWSLRLDHAPDSVSRLGGERDLEARFTLPVWPGGGARQVNRVAVLVGTYHGTASGTLRLQLCAAAGCRQGEAALIRANDNTLLTINLEGATLPLQSRETVQMRIVQLQGDPVAIWAGPLADSATRGPDGEERAGIAPIISIYADQPGVPRLAYRGPRLVIREIEAAAPYLEVVEGGPCLLRPVGRRQVEANCVARARLLRREFDFPGWAAWRDDTPVRLERVAPLFHAVSLPAGYSHVTFRYAPPALPFALSLAAVGFVLLLLPHIWRSCAALRLRARLEAPMLL